MSWDVLRCLEITWLEMTWDDLRRLEMAWDDLRWLEMTWDDMRYLDHEQHWKTSGFHFFEYQKLMKNQRFFLIFRTSTEDQFRKWSKTKSFLCFLGMSRLATAENSSKTIGFHLFFEHRLKNWSKTIGFLAFWGWVAPRRQWNSATSPLTTPPESLQQKAVWGKTIVQCTSDFRNFIECWGLTRLEQLFENSAADRWAAGLCRWSPLVVWD